MRRLLTLRPRRMDCANNDREQRSFDGSRHQPTQRVWYNAVCNSKASVSSQREPKFRQMHSGEWQVDLRDSPPRFTISVNRIIHFHPHDGGRLVS